MYIIKLFNFLAPLIYIYRYKFKNKQQQDPYKQTTLIFKNLSKTNQLHKKILMVPFRVASGSNLFEGNCSIIFQERGYEVDYLLCGQSVNYCEEIDSSRKKLFRCNLCFYEQKKFITSFKGNPIFVNQYITKDEYTSIKKEIETIDLNNIKNYLYLNVSIYKPLLSAVQLYLKQSSFCLKTHEKIIKGYLETIFITIKAMDNYFIKNTVELVCLSHGVYSTWGAVQEYCLSRSIKFVTYGREYNGAGIIAAHNDSYLNEPMYEKNSSWDHHPLTIEQKDKITDYLLAKIGLHKKAYDFISYNSESNIFFKKDELYQRLQIDVNKKIIALFPNIPWDGQTYRPALIFENINAWIYETIEWMSKKEDCVLVIRTHPAEKYMINTAGGIKDVLEGKYGNNSLPDYIKLIPADSDIRSIAIAQHSLGALLYGSTIGYETTFLKVPTILASKFFYSDKEITFDPKTKEEYFSFINKVISGELIVDNARYERLLQYAYHYNFRRIMPETLMNLKGLSFVSYKKLDYQSFIDDKVINKFIDKCLSGEKFYFDECY